MADQGKGLGRVASEILPIRISSADADRVKALADAWGCSKSEVARELILQGLDLQGG